MASSAEYTLFADCPLPGCRNPVDDPRQPCGACLNLFGDRLRVADDGPQVSVEEFTATVAAADARVAAVMAERRPMIPLRGPAPAAAPEPGVQRKRNQLCWVCDERRSCRLDADYSGLDRWICKDCEAVR